MDLVPGTILAGRFILDRKLGEGGMGVVWAATHAVTRKVVALKMLKPERAADPTVRQRFVREARAASVVQHPNIIEIRDVLELEDGAPAMVMDLLQGESLGARIEREPALSLATLAPIMLQVVSAVGTAHAAGIVHRDLKPDNIFLVDDARGVSVRVLDFGIAKVMATGGGVEVSHGLTNTGAMLGTPFYMAPEQIYGERDIDQRADVWAIGVILYECLSGRRPTEAENLGQILRIITENEIVPLSKLVPGLPDDVTALVARMLKRHRADRPLSLIEAFDVLVRHAGGRTASAFGEAAVAVLRDSLTSPDESAQRARVRVGDDGTGHGATQVSGTTGKIVSGSGDVSPTAATLASTTASLSSDQLRALPPKRRRVVALVSVATLVVAAGATALAVATRSNVVGTNASAALVAPPPSTAAPSSFAAPLALPSAVAAASVTSEPATSASAAPSRPRSGPPASPRPSASSPAPKTAPSKSTPGPSPYDHM